MKPVKKTILKPRIKKVDETLDNYLENKYFKDKLEKANAILREVGLPDKFVKPSRN